MMKYIISFFLLSTIVLSNSSLYAQNPGFIYKQSSNSTIRQVLDPNGDGYISISATGFSGTDYGAQSELRMIPLPIIGAEPSGDVSTGGSGGHTDIVSNTSPNNQSVYVLYKKVGSVYYLIFRFRIGGASTAAKGYSILFDTDGVFGGQYPNVSDNPGFEKEVVMETGPGGRIGIYNHNNNGATLATSFNVDEYSQRSIALTTVNGTTDYFYDFCVPYPSLDLSFDPVRTVSVTITSANSGLVGTKADFNGINDKLYGNDPTALANALISSSPAVPLTSMIEGYVFPQVRSLTPSVNAPVNVSATSISGTSGEDNGSIVEVFKNGIYIGTTTVSGNAWTLNAISGLVLGDRITATVKSSTKSLSALSAELLVTAAPSCYTPPPTITSLANGSQEVGISWTNPNGVISANNVKVRLYNAASNFTEITAASGASTFLSSGSSTGTLTFTTSLSQNNFNNARIYATVTTNFGSANACTSGYSNTGSTYSNITATPSIVTQTIYASNSATTVRIKNEDPFASKIYLYVNGNEVASTAGVVASGANVDLSYTGFVDGDIVAARALSSAPSSGNNIWILSNISASVRVAESNISSAAPVISGTYLSTATSVSGTSTELPGTIIRLYNGSTLIGTTTVNAGGAWTITGLTLTASQVLTAKADAVGKAESNASNSITVSSPNNSIPTITGPINAGATSISGTGASGTLTVYVDGAPIGTINNASGNWSLTNIAPEQMYRGGVLTATNKVNGIESATSSPVTIAGVTGFDITDASGNALTTIQAGQSFTIRVRAKDGNNLYTGFTGNVNVTSSNAVIGTGSGITSNFIAGILNTHSISFNTAGANRVVSVVNVNDPSANGSTTINVTAASLSAISINQPIDITPGQTRAAYTLRLTDTYGNTVNAGAPTIISLSSDINTGSFYTASTGGTQISSVTIPTGSSNATVYFDASAAGYYTVTASSIGLTSAVDQIVAGFIWQGDISVDWGTAGNWEGNLVPSTNDEVVIANKVTYWPALDMNRSFKNLNIAANASLDLNGYTLTISGTLTGTGVFIGSGTSSLIFDGTGSIGTIYMDQSSDGSSNKLQSLTINRSAGGVLNLGGNLRVNSITLTQGFIDLGDVNLYVSTVTGANANSYLKTSGIGLVKCSLAQNTSFTFPVGNATYNPVKISNKTNVANEEFGVQVIDEVFADGNGRRNSNKVVNSRVIRTWEITKASAGPASGSGVDLEFNWNNGELLNANVNNLFVYHYSRGSGWGKQNGTHSRDAVARKVSYTGYNGSFSPFSLQDETGNLPVVWGNISATFQSGFTTIRWNTLSEIDTKEYLVQHSTNGLNWTTVGVVPAHQNSRMNNVYSFIHSNPTIGKNYYRITEKSHANFLQYSSILVVNVPLKARLSIKGNPVTDGVLKIGLAEDLLFYIIDGNGRIVLKVNGKAGLHSIDVNMLSKGTYLLKAGSESVKFVKQ